MMQIQNMVFLVINIFTYVFVHAHLFVYSVVERRPLSRTIFSIYHQSSFSQQLIINRKEIKTDSKLTHVVNSIIAVCIS